MGYTVTYTGTKVERMERGLADAYGYLGADNMRIVLEDLVKLKNGMGKRVLVKYGVLRLSMIGIRGVPARALILEALRI